MLGNENKKKASGNDSAAGKIHSAIDKVYNRYSNLSTLGKIGVVFLVLEGGRICFVNGRGIVENITKTKPVSSFLGMLHEIIFAHDLKNLDLGRSYYKMRRKFEKNIDDNFGQLFGIISKLAFYFKDSYIDFIRAFM